MARPPEHEDAPRAQPTTSFKSTLYALAVYSDPTHVDSNTLALKLIEEVLQESQILGYPIPLRLLGQEIKSGENYRKRVFDLARGSILGVVILDGMRPNVTYELGLLDGLGRPTLLLSTHDAIFSVKSLYPHGQKGELLETGLSPQNIRFWSDPRLDVNRQLSDNSGIHVVHTPSPHRDTKGFKSKVRESLEKLKEDILKSPHLDSKIRELESGASQAFDDGEFETVLKLTEEMLEIDSTSQFWLTNKAIALAELGRTDEALKIVDAVLAVDSNHSVGWGEKGVILEMDNRPDDAIKAFSRALELEPANVVARINRATARVQLHDYSGALAEVNSVLRDSPREERAWITKGIISLSNNNPDEALACAEKAIEINPSEGRGWTTKARALLAKDRKKKALETIEAAFAIVKPRARYHEMYWCKAQILSELDDHTGEISALDTCLKLQSFKSHTWFHLGIARSRNDESESAVQAFEHAMELGEDKGRCYSRIGGVYSENGDLVRAREYFEKATSSDPTLDDAWNNLASVSVLLGDPASALAASMKALARDPRNAQYASTKIFALGLLGGGHAQVAALSDLCKGELKGLPSAWFRLCILSTIEQETAIAGAALAAGRERDPDGLTFKRYEKLFAKYRVNLSVESKRKSKRRL